MYKKNLSTIIFFILITSISSAQSEQRVEQPDSLVSIITTDGSEIVGYLKTESDEQYSIETPAGIQMNIPKSAVVKMTEFEGKVVKDKLYRPDPNKSMYLFSPSAFPIGDKGRYCRDFCVIFPSYNFGIGDIVSVQLGAIWIGGTGLDDLPLVASAKYTFSQNKKSAYAAGIMYMRIPLDENFGAGFTFVTGTFGDRYSHGTLSLGWGFVQHKADWEFMDRPIIVLAGNKRMSNKFALVTENWLLPEVEPGLFPLSLSLRFFGNGFAVDVGMIFTLDLLEESLPLPILNFTYHFK
ncbi:hypothetical protein ACFL46_01890 [Candidatus Neomarinimicrobiota bacterium]